MEAWGMENGKITRRTLPDYLNEKEGAEEYLNRLGYPVLDFTIGVPGDCSFALGLYTSCRGEGWLLEVTIGSNDQLVICETLGDLADALRILAPLVKIISG